MYKQKQKVSISQKQKLSEQQIKDLGLLSSSYNDLMSHLIKATDEIPYLSIKKQNYDQDKTLDWIPNSVGHGITKNKIINELSLQINDKYLLEVIIYLIQNLDNHGFIQNYNEILKENRYPSTLIAQALQCIQKNGPIGIGARNVKEFLNLQIDNRNDAPRHTEFIINNYLEDIAFKNYRKIIKYGHISQRELDRILVFIQSLKSSIELDDESTPNYIIPEVYIYLVKNNQIQVSLIEENQFNFEFNAPQLSNNDAEITKFISKQRNKAKSLQNSYHRREKTLLSIANEIAQRQIIFFKTAGKKINPLTEHEIAIRTNLSISTISRTTKNKYFQCEFGVFPLSHLFSSKSVSNESQRNILNILTQIIKKEDNKKPLSDQEIVNKLRKYNIHISRRTVAKYRKKLFIPNQFKRIQ